MTMTWAYIAFVAMLEGPMLRALAVLLIGVSGGVMSFAVSALWKR